MKWMPVFMVIGLLTWGNNSALAFDPCADIITHTPRADVNHNPSVVTVPNPVEIPLTIDLADRYGIDVPQGMNLDTNFGTIAIYKNGDVFYNGKDISGDIKDVCDHDKSGEFETIIDTQTGEDSDNPDKGG